jgi:NADPH2:quinone reductase
MLRNVLDVRPGEWLLITAGGSAIGKAVARLSGHFGYRVISVVRGDENEAALRALGATEVVVTSREDLVERVRDITSGRGVRYAMDCVGGELTGEVVHCMGMGGHLVVYGTLSGAMASFTTRDLMMPTSRIEGFFLPNWLVRAGRLTALGALLATKKLVAAGMFEVRWRAAGPGHFCSSSHEGSVSQSSLAFVVGTLDHSAWRCG